MKLTCWGAAGTVTGSMHLLQTDSGRKLLIDCGIYYEKNRDIRENNARFPFNPAEIDAVILTHAHIDHCGNLPNLVRQGFKGPIYCTPATQSLTYHLLEDSLHIQLRSAEKELERVKKNKKGGKKKGNDPGLLYYYKDIKQTMEQILTLSYGQEQTLLDAVSLTFYNAGHILGAASIRLKIKDTNREMSIGFTGDLGNYNSKLMVDPVNMPPCDYLISEATYGGRFHTPDNDPCEILLEHIQKTCVGLSGKLIIPAFSVGRTQAILFALHQLYERGVLPPIPIYTDSPLAIKTTELYGDYAQDLNEEAQLFLRNTKDLFRFEHLHTITNPKHSELVSAGYEPCVIVSAAGMVEGGRIQAHIRNSISNPFSTILIAGYCADGTLGHLLLQGLSKVIINKKERSVMAQIRRTDAFSAHPDHNGLLRYLDHATNEQTKGVFLVHADPFSSAALQAAFTKVPVTVAEKAKEYFLD